MSKTEGYRQVLHTLKNWDSFLLENAGLTSPRGSLEPAHVLSMENAEETRGVSFKFLRQAMGYCWSVAVAALPEVGKSMMENWLDREDKDICRVMKENLKKNIFLPKDTASGRCERSEGSHMSC